MRQASPPRYFQEEDKPGVQALVTLRGDVDEVAAVVEALRAQLEVRHDRVLGNLLGVLGGVELHLREYDHALAEVLELEAGVDDD